jgi:hypothetical protein
VNEVKNVKKGTKNQYAGNDSEVKLTVIIDETAQQLQK